MKKWVKAFKSKKYKQGTGTLKHYDNNAQARHCCLGVLCELYNDQMRKNKKKTLSEKTLNHDSFSHGVVEFNRNRDYLPKKVVDWADMKGNFGEFYDQNNNRYNSLSDLNDDGKKFNTIANIIEKNWESI